MKAFINVCNVCIFSFGVLLQAIAQCPTGTPTPLTCGSTINVGPNQVSGLNGLVSTSAATCGGNKFSYADIYEVTYEPGMSIFLDHWWSQYQNAEVYLEVLDANQSGCPSIVCNSLLNNGVGSIVGTSFTQNPVGMNNSIASITTSLDELDLVNGQTVYIKVMTSKKTSGGTTDNSASGAGIYTLTCVIKPENSCENSTPMIGDSTYTVDNQYAGDNYSNLDSEGTGCGFSIENNVMFQWCTDPLNTQVEVVISNVVIHDPVSGSMQFGILQGPCGGPYSVVQCNSGITLPAIIPINNANTVANTCYWIMLDGNAGTWWTIDLELQNASPVILPVQLTKFEGTFDNGSNHITWQTISEFNNDYFLLERSLDGQTWEPIAKIDGAYNSRVELNYSYDDKDFSLDCFNYYRLHQYDYNGEMITYDPISILNVTNKKIVKILNSVGQEVSSDYRGVVIYFFSDGTTEMHYQNE